MNETELDAAERYARLWQSGAPDLDEFLSGVGPLDAAELAAILRIDQRERWQAGERAPAEHYIRRLPGTPADAELALDLIYNEYLVRERIGDCPESAEFCRRFPMAAEALRDQFAMHQAIGEPPPSTPTAPVADTEVLPRSFGRYQLLEIIGRGGMGTVYLASDSLLGRQVALKIPRFGAACAIEAAERFRREARSAAKLQHPHLVPVYDIGEVDGVDYLTMPYITGESLATRLAREGAVSPTEATRIAGRVAETMEAVHRAGIVHRDLKPSNILLDTNGEPIITDFGLAKQIGGSDPRVTESGAVLGTAAYLPPEQIGCLPEAIGPRCDVYSLGGVLYEMLTGRVPFLGSPGEVLLAVVSREPEPPSRLRPGLDPRWDVVCLKAMAKHPDQRYQSMAEFATALCSPSQDAIAPRRRYPVWIFAVAVIGLLVGLSIWLASRPATSVIAPTNKPDMPVAIDSFGVGSEWAGTYRFTRPASGGAGSVELRINKRTGNTFTGEYATRQNGMEYMWKVSGRIESHQIQWKLDEPLNANTQRASAIIRGDYAGGNMTATYKDDDSEAEMKLMRKP